MFPVSRTESTWMVPALIAAMCTVGCKSPPLSVNDLDSQEAAIATEGSAAMRGQDGTQYDQRLATIGGDYTPQGDPFDPDPFIARERLDDEAGMIEGADPANASSIEAGGENTGGSQALPDL